MSTAIIVMFLIGFICAFLLAMASRFFYVPKDPNTQKILDLLSGANCGGCGYAGCGSLAKAIADKKAPVNACPAITDATVAIIAGYMGTEAVSGQNSKAYIKCMGGKNCSDKYDYSGVNDCVAISIMEGGNKSCSYGCLGAGTCIKSCPFDAIKINDAGVAEIIFSKCTGCGICLTKCPKKLIVLGNKVARYFVSCASNDKGGEVRKNCSKGCIGCKICEKTCRFEAIKVDNFLASIDSNKCTSCDECVQVCPTHAIFQKN